MQPGGVSTKRCSNNEWVSNGKGEKGKGGKGKKVLTTKQLLNPLSFSPFSPSPSSPVRRGVGSQILRGWVMMLRGMSHRHSFVPTSTVNRAAICSPNLSVRFPTNDCRALFASRVSGLPTVVDADAAAVRDWGRGLPGDSVVGAHRTWINSDTGSRLTIHC